MAPKTNDESLAKRLGHLCDLFDSLWRAGKTPRIEDFLADVDVLERPTFLRELLAVEVEYRLSCGQQPALAEYISRFPELSSDSTIIRELEPIFGGGAIVNVSTVLGTEALCATPFTGYISPDAGSTPAPQPLSNSNTSSLEESALSVGTQFGRYRLERLLGEGGMGRVFQAHDKQLDRQVALKIPFQKAATGIGRDRFMREARSAALLRHPNICPIFDVGEMNGVVYLTMAFIEGEPLTKHSKPGTLLPQRQVAILIQKLALAIHEAHERGVVHRDLKPDNIMLDNRGEPIVMDFGLARRDQPGESTLTHEGTIMGTPAYMSPEQVEGDTKAIGPRSDIYSLGVILFELLAGQRPFQGSAATLMAKILRDAPPSLSSLRHDVEPKLEWVCWKAMAKRQAERYSNGRDMADAIGQFLDGSASARSPLMIRSPTKVIEAPTEPIETYQLTPKPAPANDDRHSSAPSTGNPTSVVSIKHRVQELLGDTDLSKLLLTYAELDRDQRPKQQLSAIVRKGREEIQSQLQSKQQSKALRTAAAMHLVCASPETLAELASSADAVSKARWSATEPAAALNVWQKLLTAFPNEASLRQQAANFASHQAVVASKSQEHVTAVEVFRQAMKWDDTAANHKHFVTVLKRAAVSAIDNRQFERARTLCDEALQIAPDDPQLKKLRLRTQAK